jgi:predicted Rossmann fold flavoprotein
MSEAVEIVVVGGGAAGMTAAIAAARLGARVKILERLPRVGKKLLATGNGRCNLTNMRLSADHYHGRAPGFAAGALGRFGLPDTLAFFEGLGIATREEDGGKVFPRSGQASSVLDVLRWEMERLGVEVTCEARVRSVRREGAGFVLDTGGERAVRADRVILAAGGRAAPNLGSNGSGYDLALACGHSLVEPFPALTRLRLSSSFLKRLKGVKIDGEAGLFAGGDLLQGEAGEILFTDTGLSGPPILQLSRRAGEALRAGREVCVSLDLASDFTTKSLYDHLRERFTRQGEKDLEAGLVGFMNKRLIPVLLREACLGAPGRRCASVTDGESRGLADVLKSFRMEVTGTDSWMEAQVTAGGIDTSDVEAAILESKLVPGLFFAGEILDIDGDCGGFNLQWAWSSGHVAGESAAR